MASSMVAAGTAEQWGFVKKFVCDNCTTKASKPYNENSRGLLKVQQQQCQQALKQDEGSSTDTSSTCCIHAFEEHVIDWVKGMCRIGDRLTSTEIRRSAQLAISEMGGHPFDSLSWFHSLLTRYPDLSESFISDEKITSAFHSALGPHENTFKTIVSLVFSLGIYTRKADLNQLAVASAAVLGWQTAFPCQAPGLSWCRRFVTRYPETSRYLYLQNKVANLNDINCMELVRALRPYIDANQSSLTETQRQHVYSQLTSFYPIDQGLSSSSNNNALATGPRVCDVRSTPVARSSCDLSEVELKIEDGSNDCSSASSSFNCSGSLPGSLSYSFPNKFVRNAIIEDVLDILCRKNALVSRDEMCTAVKIIADLFSWKTVYENNLPSKSWTMRFMSERPILRDYMDNAKTNQQRKLERQVFHEMALSAIEDSKVSQHHYPEFYAAVDQ